ncbi:MAG: alginate export family protein [Myxococcales bacterium]|nr:alginate export family protein [Myxococcales bacterium]
MGHSFPATAQTSPESDLNSLSETDSAPSSSDEPESPSLGTETPEEEQQPQSAPEDEAEEAPPLTEQESETGVHPEAAPTEQESETGVHPEAAPAEQEGEAGESTEATSTEQEGEAGESTEATPTEQVAADSPVTETSPEPPAAPAPPAATQQVVTETAKPATLTLKQATPALNNPYDNDYYKILLDFRARMDLADVQEPEDAENEIQGSQAVTFRTRFGITSKPLFGFSALAEGEGTFSADKSLYFDAVSEPNGHTPVADPENIELNRLWLEFAKKEWLGLKVKAGRQRIIFDDARLIGNVGWRQNEQTFDAALAHTNAGVENLSITYAYLFDVRRIFGDQGPANRQDFESNSHLARVAYSLPFGINLVGFAYLLDFENSPVNSADTFGGRASVQKKFEPLTLGLIASYARQVDAGNNPVDYEADYVNLEGSVGIPVGSVKAGYELLGSDNGEARFVTPLSTAHKFNGFADVFLNNGGARGLQDLYASISPRLPLNLKGFITYHHFWAHEGAASLGDEVDFVVKRGVGKHVLLLSKGAYFFADDSGSAQDIWRFTLDMNVKY